MDIKIIIEAWRIANNPTEKQIELSEKRLSVCETCEFRKEIIKGFKIGNVCTKCGCPIAKKAFTNTYNPCPEKKWNETDLNYFDEQKTNKTLL